MPQSTDTFREFILDEKSDILPLFLPPFLRLKLSHVCI